MRSGNCIKYIGHVIMNIFRLELLPLNSNFNNFLQRDRLPCFYIFVGLQEGIQKQRSNINEMFNHR